MDGMRIVKILFKGQMRECIEGQLIVKVKPDIAKDANHINQLLSNTLGSKVSFRVVEPFDENGIGLVEFGKDRDIALVAETLEKSPEILYAEPNDVTRISGAPSVAPSDPLFSQQWSLLTIQAPATWALTQGSSNVVIAVLDTGLPMAGNPPVLSHEDLNDQIRFFLGGNYISPGTPPIDRQGHGTHVAGIAAAEGNNGTGISGVNWRCRVLACKVFDDSPVGNGSVFSVYRATQESINFARSMGARLVINYSGGGTAYTVTYEEIARIVQSAGALFCAAAGNDYGGPVHYPAALSTRPDGSVWYPNIIAVSATTRGDELAAFSNRGVQVNVSAPGEDILSTFPNYPVSGTTYTNYGVLNGTSMATPIVSGVASLVWSREPNLAASQVRERLQATAVDLGIPGRDALFGFGRVNAFAAVQPIPIPPPPPPPDPWTDPVVRQWIDEWIRQQDRCVKQVFPMCYVDRWGRMCGGHINCTPNPDHPPGWDNYHYLWHHNWCPKYYSFSVRGYVERRRRGESPESLARCKKEGAPCLG
jgi:subtilisin family serine protease